MKEVCKLETCETCGGKILIVQPWRAIVSPDRGPFEAIHRCGGRMLQTEPMPTMAQAVASIRTAMQPEEVAT